MAGVVRRWQLMRIRSRLALIAAVVLVGAYGWLAIYEQPVVSGYEMLETAPGQTTLHPFAASGSDSFIAAGAAPILVVDYVDGAASTLVKTLSNSGPLPVTITGVETGRTDWRGLVTIKEARSAVVVGPAPCCELNQTATWSAPDFHWIQLAPYGQGVVAVHLLMSNCENGGAGGYWIVDHIKVDYIVLGFPHAQDVAVGPYWFRSPDTCPRAGPA
jgi:hypothetical protein